MLLCNIFTPTRKALDQGRATFFDMRAEIGWIMTKFFRVSNKILKCPQLHWFPVLHFSIWGSKLSLGSLVVRGLNFWPLLQRPPRFGGYGMRLIRLCL